MNKISCVLSLVCAALAMSQVACADDLPVVAFWQFNDASNPCLDSSGNGLHLDYKSTPPDFVGGYAQFPDDYTAIKFGRLNLDLRSYSVLTVELWVRELAYQHAPYTILSYYGWNQQGGFFGLWGGGTVESAGVVHSVLTKTTENEPKLEKDTSDSDALSDHRWHHIAYVIDVSSDDTAVVNETKLYIDGILQTKGTSAAHHGVAFPRLTHFLLGCCDTTFQDVSCKYQLPFKGDMDDVRITAAALTPDQFLKAPTVTETAHADEAVVWTDSTVTPAAGADVYVPTNAAVTLSAETPIFNSITVDGSIRFATSNNCLKATTVRVGAAGRLVAGDPYVGKTEVSNQIQVACTDFTLDQGGIVTAAGAGFLGGSTATGGKAYGPGAGIQKNDDLRHTGASHGSFNTSSPYGCDGYGSAEWPVTAGSGGYRYTTDIDASNGGGAIRIDAAGTVTVNGEISADAPDLVSYPGYGRSGAGSGGSILISCAKLVGSGKLSAAGGWASGHPTCSGNGAGGRIAVHYDAAQQTAADIADMTFDVKPGRRGYSYGYALVETGDWMYAGAGTLWFTDAKVLNATTLAKMHGRIMNAAEVTVDGDLTLSDWLGFGTDGAVVRVNGNLTLDGKDARFEMGAVARYAGTDAYLQRKSYVSSVSNVLDVTGDIVVTNAARFDVYAAATNGVGWHGAVVRAGGSFVVATNSLVYPFADPTNGGAPAFLVRRLDVMAGGTLGIAGGGFSGRHNTESTGYGPGRGYVNAYSATADYGAGHGGFGGGVVARDGDAATTNTTKFGQCYGNALRPTLAGSGGALCYVQGNGGGMGGCAIQCRAAESMSIEGKIVADGTSSSHGHNQGSSGGSGGSVLLESPSVSFGPNAKVTAIGGDSQVHEESYAGGGGRIAVWTGKYLWEPGWRKSRYTVSSEIPAAWADVFSVAGGAKKTSGTGAAGEDGTIRFVSTLPPPGMMLFIR